VDSGSLEITRGYALVNGMTYVEEAIQKAIGAGWDGRIVAPRGVPYIAATLDPFFWQSLGKALGWKVETYEEEVMIPYTHEIRTITKTKKGHRLVPPWRIRWHRFIDHLAAGKHVEQFFEDLLK
jgi:hypothetical protein